MRSDRIVKLENDSLPSLRDKIVNLGVGKYRLPNLFNKVGSLFSKSRYLVLNVCGLTFINIAIFLNPSQEYFILNRHNATKSIIEKLSERSSVVSPGSSPINNENHSRTKLCILLFNDIFSLMNPFSKRFKSRRKELIKSVLDVLNKEQAPKLLLQESSIYENKFYPIYGMEVWCKKKSYLINQLGFDKLLMLTAPNFINPELREEKSLYTGLVKLPKAYLAELENVTIFGGTDLVFDEERRQVVYDEIACSEPSYYDLKSRIILEHTGNRVSINYDPSKDKLRINEAIHFVKDHSRNYFHWIIECLPRLAIIQKFSHLDSVPIIIDADLTMQHLDALNLINEDKNPIISLPFNQALHVDKLYYPSSLSIVHDNHYSPVRYDQDMIYSPQAIKFVRETILSKVTGDIKTKPFRKLYLVRDSTLRLIINSNEVKLLMKDLGFEIVAPELLSFSNQVKLFSEAKSVVSQGGACLANLIFAPAGCNVLVLINNNKINNYNMFHGWTSHCGIDLKHMLGVGKPFNGTPGIHYDFSIDLDLLKKTILTDFS